MNTVVMTRMRALGRAEMTLLLRNRTALFTAMLMPLLFVLFTRMSVTEEALDATGFSVGGLVLSAGLGIVLVLVVYSNLVASFVARRQELTLKRLRTGEPSGAEILGGTALPSVAIGLTQCAVLVVAGVLALDVRAPARVDVLLAGLLVGVVMMTALAAATSAFTKSTESAQLTVLPLMMLSLIGSGLMVPLEMLPDGLAAVARLLPLSPVMELVRHGWLGEGDGVDVLRALGLSVVWCALAVFAVRRWFRWEPRR
ncbi:ABC transporter permease [Streptomyces sp. GSL17-111]|uniref:ABC transporter permease n=1 Tax=Streptomyces sp. GSL17-111 TaxID=3121596 RepID=UPI0030F48DEB